MPLVTVASRNAAAVAIANGCGFASLHTAFPGDSGTNEVTGVGYTRIAETWNIGAPSGGSVAASGVLPTWTVPAGTTVAWVGSFSLVTAGTFGSCAPLGGGLPKPFTAQAATGSPGTADTLACEAHGFAADTKVVLIATGQIGLPAGFSEGTIYYVRNPTTDGFQLATAAGGSPIDITADGAGFVTTIVPETFAGGGTLTLSADTISNNQ